MSYETKKRKRGRGESISWRMWIRQIIFFWFTLEARSSQIQNVNQKKIICLIHMNQTVTSWYMKICMNRYTSWLMNTWTVHHAYCWRHSNNINAKSWTQEGCVPWCIYFYDDRTNAEKSEKKNSDCSHSTNITYCLFILPIQIQDIGRVGLMWSTACIWFGYSICYQVLFLYYGVVWYQCNGRCVRCVVGGRCAVLWFYRLKEHVIFLNLHLQSASFWICMSKGLHIQLI